MTFVLLLHRFLSVEGRCLKARGGSGKRNDVRYRARSSESVLVVEHRCFWLGSECGDLEDLRELEK